MEGIALGCVFEYAGICLAEHGFVKAVAETFWRP